jgi:LuxR family transcriptional regulator, activator of conjugal transfer of Ti plasmids
MYEFEDFVEQSRKIDDRLAVWAYLEKWLKRDGYENLVFVQLLNNGHIEIPWKNLPNGYDDTYVQNKWHQIDPVLQHTMSAVLPFQWTKVERQAGLKLVQKRFFEDCLKLGVHSGFTTPIHAPGRRDIVSISLRERMSVDQRRLPLLHALIQQTWMRYTELSAPSAPQHELVTLSDRERSCLFWVKSGKTYEEIAEILHVSPKTVEAYLRSSRTKLGVGNTLTAVVKAIQLGLI